MLYYVEMLQKDRQTNLIDYQPPNAANATKEDIIKETQRVIQEDLDRKHAAAELKERKRMEVKLKKAKEEEEKRRIEEVKNGDSKEKKEKYDKDGKPVPRYEQLAKPKDKWKVGKKLIEL